MTDTAIITAAGISSNYSTLALILLSLFGVLIHMMNDIAKEKQKPAPYVYTFAAYWSKCWPAIITSLLICCVVIIIRHEFMHIPDFSNWEGAAMALIGYFGGSILTPLSNFLTNKWGIKNIEP